MRKKLLIIFALVSCLYAYSQAADDDYTPLVREGSEWTYYCPSDQDVYKYILRGDSVVGDTIYKKFMRIGHYMVMMDDSVMTWPYMTTTHCLLREDNKRVYGRQVDWSNNDINRLVGELYDTTTQEVLLYDFNDLEKFYHYWLEYCGGHYDGTLVHETTDSCLLVNRKCYRVDYALRHRLIEGIGAYGKYGDVVQHNWRVFGASRGYKLVALKNSDGEYEYFNNELYKEMVELQHDPHRDKTVNVSDLTTVINNVLGIKTDKVYYLYGSITEDNDFDEADVNSVVNYIIGNIKSPLGK